MIVLLIFIAFLLRLVLINQSLWLDEGINVIFAQKLSFLDLLIKYPVGDFHPPLFHLFLKLQILVFGNSEISVRLPSVIFGVATVIMTYLICKKLYEKKTALIAATLIATSPLHIYYSQEARMYSLAALLSTLSVYFFISILKDEKKLYWLGFIFSTTALLYSDYLPYLLVLTYPMFLFFYRKNLKNSTKASFLPAFLLIAIFVFPWVFVFRKQLETGIAASNMSPAWSQIVGSSEIKNLFLAFVKFLIGRISSDNNVLYAILFLPVGIFSFFMFGISSLRLSKLRAYLFFWFLFPIIFAFILSFIVPVFSYFRFIFILPAMYIVIASGINTVNITKVNRTFLITMLFINLTCVSIYFLNPKFHREDWKSATKYVAGNSSQGTVVLFESNYTMSPFDYYNNGKLEAKGALKKWNPQSSSDLENIKELTQNKSQIFLFQYLSEITDPESLVFREISSLGFKNTGTHDFNGVGFLYEFKRI